MDKHLHIVSFDVPWPVMHGGHTDLFYKLVYLHSAGIKIHYHCFKKDERKEEAELNKYCTSVNYYKRETGAKGMDLQLPYIVSSRNSEALIQELSKDGHPILLEGIHCTWILYKNVFPGRKIIVRLHNIEYKYYRQLARYENNPAKKLYYLKESLSLKKYEKEIAGKAIFFAVSKKDSDHYNDKMNADSRFLPAFTSFYNVTTLPDTTGSFCLYQGNLSINENEKAVYWLLEKVFAKTDLPLVIAGKNPSEKLIKKLSKRSNSILIINPSDEKMDELIANAQIHLIPSFNNTGVKLKLLHALFKGRHCLVNQAAVDGSGIEKACHICKDAQEFQQKIELLFKKPLSISEKREREAILKNTYDNEKNLRLLMTSIW